MLWYIFRVCAQIFGDFLGTFLVTVTRRQPQPYLPRLDQPGLMADCACIKYHVGKTMP